MSCLSFGYAASIDCGTTRRALFRIISDLHSVGVNHGDLSPRNVTCHPNGTLRIIDFTHSSVHKCTGFRKVGVSSDIPFNHY